MRIVRTARALKRALEPIRQKSRTIGFVPTMGFLHEGHASLVRASKMYHDVTVVSIFVNPLQFGPKEDFSSYPRDLKKDKALLQSLKVDFLYVPAVRDFYPKEFQTTVTVNSLSQTLCGKARPAHFAGVTTVVLKLLNVVQPHTLFLGQKDFQQCRVIEQMVMDMGVGVRVRRMPIVRESDGLAMSSRNTYLSREDRVRARCLNQALAMARSLVQESSNTPNQIKMIIGALLAKASPAKVDYVEIVDACTLQNVVNFSKDVPVVLVALAVYFGSTRLIDNAVIPVR